ncbi:integrase repeat-containing protein [Pseudomonas sp. RC10]|uniref:integrase repeat-containing protein n=1 Tax=Pseudomonas bambusae TaxID=3139142 RepID=UPI00313A31DA
MKVDGLRIRLPIPQSVVQKDQKMVSDMNNMIRFYAFSEARVAVRQFGITTSIEYAKRYREDPRLPSAPAMLYAGKGWAGWHDFLGRQKRVFHPTYRQAQLAVSALGIRRYSDYLRRYREDPHLPSWPNVTYANCGWMGWSAFLGGETDLSSTHGKTWSAAQQWLCLQGSAPVKNRAIKSVILGVLKHNGLPDNPLGFADRVLGECELYRRFLKKQPRGKLGLLTTVAEEFSLWLLRAHESRKPRRASVTSD